MNGFSSYNDQELLLQIAEGDQKAFDALFEKYRDSLFYYLAKIIKSKETAEEIVLDVFLKIWTGRSAVIEIDHFEAFLFRVARNKAIDFLRQVKKSRLQQTALWEKIQEKTVIETADQQMLLAEINDSVQRAVAQLSPQRKQVFQLSREQGLTYEQIGRRLHLSTHTVRNHLSASLQFIRAHLNGVLSYMLLVFYFFSRLH